MIDTNIENLSEPFKSHFKYFLADCKKAGLDVRMGEGKRIPETQLLYAIQGCLSEIAAKKDPKNKDALLKQLLAEYHALRKMVGLFAISDSDALNKNITWTLMSNHYKGSAADVLVYVDGKVNWNPGDAVWEQIAVIAEKNGLSSGHGWPKPKQDSPHIELKGL